MAVEIYEFGVTVPAGTLPANPQVSPLSLPPRIVDRVQVIVPPGPHGLLGFALGFSGAQVIPRNPGAWIVTDDEKIDWPLEDQPTSGAWQLLAYNSGLQAHQLRIRFLCRPTYGTSQPVAGVGTLLPVPENPPTPEPGPVELPGPEPAPGPDQSLPPVPPPPIPLGAIGLSGGRPLPGEAGSVSTPPRRKGPLPL